MRDSKALFAAAAAIVLAFCGAAPPQNASRCLRTPFRGITETSATGEMIGTPDRQDWGCVQVGGSARADAIEGLSQSDPVPVPPPSGTCLLPAYPNPTTGSTRLRLTLLEGAHVTLAVYGRTRQQGPPEVLLVRTLVDSDLAAGMHEILWDGSDDAGIHLSPGIYRAVLVVGGETLCGDIEIL